MSGQVALQGVEARLVNSPETTLRAKTACDFEALRQEVERTALFRFALHPLATFRVVRPGAHGVHVRHHQYWACHLLFVGGAGGNVFHDLVTVAFAFVRQPRNEAKRHQQQHDEAEDDEQLDGEGFVHDDAPGQGSTAATNRQDIRQGT